MKPYDKLARLADKFCIAKADEYPDIWWTYGDCDEYRVLFFTMKWEDSEGGKPTWKMDINGNIEAI